MAYDELLKPTLHVEVLLGNVVLEQDTYKQICCAIAARLRENYDTVTVGQAVDGFGEAIPGEQLKRVEIADFTGPRHKTGYYDLSTVELDIQAYALKYGPDDSKERRTIDQAGADDMPKERILELPNAAFCEAWSSLVFDDGLPARLLRYLVRMVSMVSQPGLNLSTFNWNRLCLLHGPPGSGKSTLCRALAQKMSIRLGDVFQRSMLVEINTNAMLSKYFGESGKVIGATFERIHVLGEDRTTLVCVVMDEIETIAGSRAKATSGTDCNDGLRATNQLLTALDRLRDQPNIIVICTSNLLEAIDSAFLDRVDIKQLIPAPSPAAIYNIFRSCLNELMRSKLVENGASASVQAPRTPPQSAQQRGNSGGRVTKRRRLNDSSSSSKAADIDTCSSSPLPLSSAASIPSFSEMQVKYLDQPNSAAYRVWRLAQRCHGLSGRTLRRLPILGLAMHTWGGECGLGEAIAALEKAVDQELAVVRSVTNL